MFAQLVDRLVRPAALRQSRAWWTAGSCGPPPRGVAPPATASGLVVPWPGWLAFSHPLLPIHGAPSTSRYAAPLYLLCLYTYYGSSDYGMATPTGRRRCPTCSKCLRCSPPSPTTCDRLVITRRVIPAAACPPVHDVVVLTRLAWAEFCTVSRCEVPSAAGVPPCYYPVLIPWLQNPSQQRL